MRLGEILKAARLASGKTLRDIESSTGISNGYLSQLESDLVKQPSPHHLRKLADVYNLGYGQLMQLAGYLPATLVGSVTPQQTPIFSGLEDLTEEDRKKIQAYIEDLRDARRVRGMSTRGKVKLRKAAV